MRPNSTSASRRQFLKTSTAATTAALAGVSVLSHGLEESTDKIRVGLVGCGGRGTGAA
ncbi:MAG: twin-arginine translocation signal domain-containing protein, partial [Planctomycetes bacterium]|nr:twin-arginine translocation signal domain-containing protein [Planctomycetota bacterium]